MADSQTDTLTLTAEIVASFLSSETHRVTPEQIPDLIRSVRSALKETEQPQAETKPAGPEKPSKREISKSITPDALISFLDGKPYKTLKRHLTRHGLTVNSYKERFGLPSDYPSVAPSYSASRSAMAKSLGLGARRTEARTEAAKPAPAARTRKPRAKAEN